MYVVLHSLVCEIYISHVKYSHYAINSTMSIHRRHYVDGSQTTNSIPSLQLEKINISYIVENKTLCFFRLTQVLSHILIEGNKIRV